MDPLGVLASPTSPKEYNTDSVYEMPFLVVS